MVWDTDLIGSWPGTALSVSLHRYWGICLPDFCQLQIHPVGHHVVTAGSRLAPGGGQCTGGTNYAVLCTALTLPMYSVLRSPYSVGSSALGLLVDGLSQTSLRCSIIVGQVGLADAALDPGLAHHQS